MEEEEDIYGRAFFFCFRLSSYSFLANLPSGTGHPFTPHTSSLHSSVSRHHHRCETVYNHACAQVQAFTRANTPPASAKALSIADATRIAASSPGVGNLPPSQFTA